MKIYKLISDSHNFSTFIENYPEGEKSSLSGIMGQRWRPFGNNFKPVNLELWRSDTGKKNYQFDFSASLRPFLVFSEHALNELGDILKPRGQLLPVVTQSKRKKFFGYYPTNPIKHCLDMDKSKYKAYAKGLDISRYVLKAKNIYEPYLFTIDECISSVFVTSKFRDLVEKNKLLGFDFSEEIELS